MKRFVVLAACAMACLASGSVSAAPQATLQSAVVRPGDAAPTLQAARYYRYHTCTARSRYGFGVWTAPSRAVARRGALVQCALHTPRGFLCRITSCS
ncbi:MAG: hypothetical protein ACHP7N_15050 [Caulobacterales bacterium]